MVVWVGAFGAKLVRTGKKFGIDEHSRSVDPASTRVYGWPNRGDRGLKVDESGGESARWVRDFDIKRSFLWTSGGARFYSLCFRNILCNDRVFFRGWSGVEIG